MVAGAAWATSSGPASLSDSTDPPPAPPAVSACDEFLDQLASTDAPNSVATEFGFPATVSVGESFEVDKILCWSTNDSASGTSVVHGIAVTDDSNTKAWFIKTDVPLDDLTDDDWHHILTDNGYPPMPMRFDRGFSTGLDVGQPDIDLWPRLSISRAVQQSK